MNQEIKRQGNLLTVRIYGDFDLSGADGCRRAIDRQLDESVRDLVFDLSRVSFIDSSGLGVILGRYRKLTERGGKVAIAGVDTKLARILELSGLTRLMPVYSSVPAAMKGLSEGRQNN